MAILKYADGIDPLRKEHYGYTFVRSNYGRSVMQGQRNDRKRYSAQWQRMFNLIECTRNWRNLSAGIKNAWSVFAAAYPQPTKRDPDKYLTGYQLFVKRNYYQFLHEGPNTSFITDPELTILNDPEFSIMINADGQCIDITELYIARFGILPDAGQFVIVRIVPISQVGGAFFPPLIATVEVDQVYIDGLFLSFFFTSYYEEVEFSIYVSKPVWESVQYPGTKFRYMGCFKPTKFIQLTDTPDSYVGEAGKVVAVKGDETGVEFIEAGGGGFECDDLLACPAFTNLQAQVANIAAYIVDASGESFPPINFGILYNYWACINASGLARPGWRILQRADIISIRDYLGGSAVAGGKLKEAGLTYWNSPNTGATNEKGFNGRGGGQRTASSGGFQSLKIAGNLHSTDVASATNNYILTLVYSGANSSDGQGAFGFGRATRCLRDAPGIADGVVGSYVCNNGRIIRTIVINELEILADNLVETIYNDGTAIPFITDNAAWTADITGAHCYYANDSANV
jgi:hypothetical protein